MNIKFFLNNQTIDPPKDWQDIKIVCKWTNNTIQPNIVAEDYTFVGKSAKIIQDWIDNGLTRGAGIFYGMDFKIVAEDPVDGSFVTFEGILDFLQGYKVMHPNVISVRISKPEDLDLIDKKLQGLTYGFLHDNGKIDNSLIRNVGFVVTPVDATQQKVQVTILALLLSWQVLTVARQLSDDIAKIGGVTTIAYGILVAVIDAIYLALTVVLLVKALKQLFELMIPPPQMQPCLSLSDLLKVAFQYIGHEFSDDFQPLKDIRYIPSQLPDTKRSNIPIPSAQDYGYRANEMLELVLDLFNAQVQVIGNRVYIKPEGDKYWRQNAKYRLPSVLLEEYELNTEEAHGTQFFSFMTDLSDKWTIENFSGTNVQVNLESTVNIPRRNRLLKGYREIRWPVALATGTTKYGGLRKYIQNTLQSAMTSISNVLRPKSVPKIPNMLKEYIMVDQPFWSVPKLVVNQETYLSKDNRNFLNANNLYQKYHKHRSFTGDFGQKYRYKNVRIPFGLKQYLELLNSAYFTTDTGELGKMEDLQWTMGKQYAVATFVVYRKYVTSLKETIIQG